MASVGYGFGRYGHSFYGEPVFEFGEATLAESSGFTASGSITFYVSATLAETSGFSSTGHIVFLGSATLS